MTNLNSLPKIYQLEAFWDFLGLKRPKMYYETRPNFIRYNDATTYGELFSAAARYLMLVDNDYVEAKRFQELSAEQYVIAREAREQILK